MKKSLFPVISIILVWLGLTFFAWFRNPDEISLSERRKLTQQPALTLDALGSGKFMTDFEDYAKDQFPGRFNFRQLKAYQRFYVFRQLDNHDIYLMDGQAAKLEYPLKEEQVSMATDRMTYLYEKYLKDNKHKIFLSVIPDKSYYLGAQKGYPSLDYEKLFELVQEETPFASYLPLTDLLSAEDYYRSDIHLKQEKILPVAARLAQALGILEPQAENFTAVTLKGDFYGVYQGQSALPLDADQITYLSSESTQQATVYHIETAETLAVYDLEKEQGRDPYDLFLSGASPLLIIDNPLGPADKELIVFRDSFGSSLIPLLLDGYSKITAIDTRYITSDLVGEFVDFTQQDILFLYNTLILNSGAMLK